MPREMLQGTPQGGLMDLIDRMRTAVPPELDSEKFSADTELFEAGPEPVKKKFMKQVQRVGSNAAPRASSCSRMRNWSRTSRSWRKGT